MIKSSNKKPQKQLTVYLHKKLHRKKEKATATKCNGDPIMDFIKHKKCNPFCFTFFITDEEEKVPIIMTSCNKHCKCSNAVRCFGQLLCGAFGDTEFRWY